MPTNKLVQLGARVPLATRDRAKQAAGKLGQSLNRYVEDALEAALASNRAAADESPAPRTKPKRGTAADTGPPVGREPEPPAPADVDPGRDGDVGDHPGDGSAAPTPAPPPMRLPGLPR